MNEELSLLIRTDSLPGLGEQSWWGIIREHPNFIWRLGENCRGLS